MSADVRTRVVSAFHAAASSALSTGDRHMGEQLEHLARELTHRDTTDETLAGVMQAFVGPTEEPTR